MSIWTSKAEGNIYETKYQNNDHHPQKEANRLK